jgi:NADH-quinone oxidoreductase subunit F
MPKLTSRADLNVYRDELVSKRKPGATVVTLCAGTGCATCGAADVLEALKKKVKTNGNIQILTTGCHGFCERGPLMVIRPQNIFYQMVKPKDVDEIIEKTIGKGEIIERLLYVSPTTGKAVVKEEEVPFYLKQQRIVFGLNGFIDPFRIDDYISYGGYQALAKALFEMTPDQVLQEVLDAKLRGRGGGGFEAGWKWKSCKEAHPELPHHIICNAAGAFMARSILEGNPHSVLEGMIIGAYAIGGTDGFIYVHNEYPLAVKTFRNALAQAREYGLLGKNILGSNLTFDVKISRGGGAFVCGESSALFRSLEGKVGEPRAKYIHSTERGYHDEPTNLNNVETWANVPHIINKGAKWYRTLGTDGSPGTKVFSLMGNVNNTGLIEVPMGMSLREIIYGIGGGIQKGKAFKAVQTGGPSGGCLPESSLDLPVDFDKLTEAGAMMGSGGMIVMDENTCVVDVARYFIDFLIEESCGKCLPCREGLRQMSSILHYICEGKGQPQDIATLEELGSTVADCSLCALGGSAPNPVLSTIKYFREEYEAHILRKKCPGGICASLIEYEIISSLCNGCGTCESVCAGGAISPVEGEKREKGELHVIDKVKCVKCGACIEVCPTDAVIRR